MKFELKVVQNQAGNILWYEIKPGDIVILKFSSSRPEPSGWKFCDSPDCPDKRHIQLIGDSALYVIVRNPPESSMDRLANNFESNSLKLSIEATIQLHEDQLFSVFKNNITNLKLDKMTLQHFVEGLNKVVDLGSYDVVDLLQQSKLERGEVAALRSGMDLAQIENYHHERIKLCAEITKFFKQEIETRWIKALQAIWNQETCAAPVRAASVERTSSTAPITLLPGRRGDTQFYLLPSAPFTFSLSKFVLEVKDKRLSDAILTTAADGIRDAIEVLKANLLRPELSDNYIKGLQRYGFLFSRDAEPLLHPGGSDEPHVLPNGTRAVGVGSKPPELVRSFFNKLLDSNTDIMPILKATLKNGGLEEAEAEAFVNQFVTQLGPKSPTVHDVESFFSEIAPQLDRTKESK